MGNRRIWWGLGIMAAGLAAAWPFRKAWLDEQEAIATAALAPPAPILKPLLPAKLTEAHPDEPSPARTGTDEDPALPPVAGLHPLTSALERGPARRPLVNLDEAPQPPALAADFTPLAPQKLDPRSAILSEDDASPVMTHAAPLRRYRIGKHDTLESIAERLLGSRQHADKLLAANPDVILAPEVLPVGATIVIPDLRSETMVRLPDAGM